MKIIKNKKRKYIIISGLVSTFVIIGLCITYYNSIPKEEPLIGAYINGAYSKALPTKGSGYTVEKIVCDNNKNASWDYNKWGIKLFNWGTRSRCNIYFKSLESVTVANKTFYLDEAQRCPTMNSDGTVTVTGAEDTYGYLCRAKDAYGNSYYYRGNVTNNYVKFADKYWRIVRINGDGTVRVIYDGTSAHANGEDSADRQIGTSAFNSSYKDNAYVGYMYGQTGASTYAAAHANTNDSTIKAYIDNWYKTNIVGTTNEQYLVDNVFCNDRSISSDKPTSSYSNLGYGWRATAYRWYYGPWSSGGYNSSMRLMCPQKNDAFTVSDTTNGNGALTYPVGLLSSDEIVLAGGWNTYNSGYYLCTGQDWWASSPYYFNGSDAFVRYVASNGAANGDYYVRGADGVRPVFNLKAEVLAQGSGTASDPYRIS